MLLNCGIGQDSWESLGLQGDPTSPFWRKSVLNIHWKDWCWSWNSNTVITWCEELTHWKRPWCWERLKVGGEGDDRGWDGWMASLTQWTWVESNSWVNSGSWWWTGRSGMLQFMGLQRVGHDWATELNCQTGWQMKQAHFPERRNSQFLCVGREKVQALWRMKTSWTEGGRWREQQDSWLNRARNSDFIAQWATGEF